MIPFARPPGAVAVQFQFDSWPIRQPYLISGRKSAKRSALSMRLKTAGKRGLTAKKKIVHVQVYTSKLYEYF